jgi:ABC-type nitrate/sulfonate/bicarbonate transport system substrate-binding protein
VIATTSRRTALRLAVFAAGVAVTRPAFAADMPITITASSSSLAYGGMKIALEAGLFQKNGLDPKVIVMESGNAAIAAVVGGSAAFSAAGAGEVLAARVRGQDIVIVNNIYHGLSGSLVLAKSVADKLGVAPTAPVEDRLRALNGLAIATPSATSAYLTPYKSAAAGVGSTPKFLYMTQPAMVAALQVGAIQGMSAGAPFSLTPVLNGSGPKGELPAADRLTSSACLQTTRDYAKSHPDIIRAARAVFADVATLIKQKPDAAKAFLAKAYPSLEPKLLDAAFAESAANWADPVMTVDDIRQEIKVQVGAGALPGVEKLDPAGVLLGAE